MEGLNAKAKFNLDLKYYELFFYEWERYLSRFRKVRIPLGVIFIASGAFIMLYIKAFIWAYVFYALGLFEIFLSESIHRFIYLLRAKRHRLTGTEIEVDFMEDDVRIIGAYSDSTCNWNIFIKYVETPDGLFLHLQKRKVIFIPDYALEPPDAKQRIIEKLKLENN